MPDHTAASLYRFPHALCRTPGLVHGLNAWTPAPRIRTGLVALDLLLDGGLPRGIVTEIVGAGSSGRTTLACALAAAVTSAGDLAAYIDLADALDPTHASVTGIDLGRLLWVRPRDLRSALQAAEQVLDTGGFSLVLVDLDDRRGPRLMIPAGAWVRLARAAARNRSAVVILGACNPAGAEDHDHSSAGTFAALRLETERRRVGFTGSAGACPLFDGISSTIHLRKNRTGPSGATAVLFATAAA